MSAVTSAASTAREAGGGDPIRRAKGRRWTSYVLPTYAWAVIVYLALPVFVMILFGFNDVPGRVNAEWYGFTTRWYTQLFDVPGLATALKLSLGIAVVASAVATLLGALLGLALGRYRYRGSGSSNYLVFLAIASPEIVLGTSLLTMFATVFSWVGPLGVRTLILAHIMFSISFVAVTVRARVQGQNLELEEASSDLGANPWSTFWLVTFPLILPGVIAGFLLSFALSIDDFVISYFVSGSTQTFPLFVYGSTRTGTPPQVNVMGTLLFLFGVLVAIGAALAPTFRARSDRKRAEQDRQLALETGVMGTAFVGSQR
jgi:spermidine/putrescine transport system permease protein